MEDTINENEIHTFNAGDVILKQGHLAKGFYVLVSGEMEVLYDDVKVGEICDKGAFVGEIASLLGGRRTATVVAKTKVELIFIENATSYFENNTSSLLSIARALASRIIKMDQKIVEFKKILDRWAHDFEDAIEKDNIFMLKEELEEMHNFFKNHIHI